MNRKFIVTKDGSHTLYLKEMDETYHSKHGALQESNHIYIDQGFRQVQKTSMNILEIGLGTGLNLLLSYLECEKRNCSVYYHAVEKYPLVASEYLKLNYEELIPGLPQGFLKKIHNAPWNQSCELSGKFILFKELADFREMHPKEGIDLIYFDAFAPEKQPELWSAEIFSMLAKKSNPGAVLVSYSCKGSVRRALISCGFKVYKVPGPPGKREMIRAVRI